MTSIKKQRRHHNNKKEDDDTIGPKIRHPSGPVYLNVIFLRKESNKIEKKIELSGVAKLYQDIIQYSLSSEYKELLQKQEQHRKGFKITDIGYRLLDHNQDYINHYSD